MDNNLVNEDFQRELQAVNDDPSKVNTLQVPTTTAQRDVAVRDISTTALFGADALTGRTPVLTQSFIIQKSKADKLAEMGTIAQEMFETKTVSRKQVIGLEAISRELLEDNTAEGEQRAIIVSDHEVNMFTEEPSQVEAQTAIDNTQVALDRIVGELRTSAIALGTQLVQTTNEDQVERREKITKTSVLFNQAIIKFLQSTSSDSLETVNFKFKRDLRWGDLMSIPLTRVKYLSDEEYAARMEKEIASFDGTSAETFIKELSKLFTESANSLNVVQGFLNGVNTIIRSQTDTTVKNPETNQRIGYSGTIGDMFKAFGSDRFTQFYTDLNNNIETQVTAAKSAVELLNGKTDVSEINMLTRELHNQHSSIMDTCSNMAVLNRVQFLIIQFLNNY